MAAARTPIATESLAEQSWPPTCRRADTPRPTLLQVIVLLDTIAAHKKKTASAVLVGVNDGFLRL